MDQTYDILGSSISSLGPEEHIETLEALAMGPERGYVAVCNVHTTVTGMLDREYRSIINGATLAVPDGMPLVWAQRALGSALRQRSNGPMLMDRILRRSRSVGHRHYFYGGSQQAIDGLVRAYPAAHVVGAFSPPFRTLAPSEETDHVERINEAAPDFVWVGLGAPKQERWMARNHRRIDGAMLMGVGAAFDQLSGLKSSAPEWMGDRGLEWAYRFAQEPRRLARRYLVTNSLFIAAFGVQFARHRIRQSSRGA